MEEVLPLDVRKITAPYYNVSILEYWDGIYQSVFCYLKPFLKVKVNSPILKMEFEEYYFDYPLLVENTTPITWAEMVQLCRFDSIITLKKALLTNPVSYSLKEILNKVCIRENIINPYEDRFSPHQLEALVPFLIKLGYNRIKCIPQFPENELSVSMDLNLDKIVSNSRKIYSLQTEDEALLIANQFDYVETLIAGPIELIKYFEKEIEGFLCDKSTRARWSTE